MKVWNKKPEGICMRKTLGTFLIALTAVSMFSSNSFVDYAIICGIDTAFLFRYRQYLLPVAMRDEE